jgi:radical SAM superfamily enzyme YgiQ (UPF0313 family)
MIDILFLTLPRLEMRAPITAPAILKAVVEKHGYKAKCIDLNLDLWHSLDNDIHGHVWFDTDLTFRYEEKFTPFWKDVIYEHAIRWVKMIDDLDTKWIGITIFSQRSKFITIEFCKLLREKLPEKMIVVGGPYTEFLGKDLYKENLIDAYVVGEGEKPVIDVIEGNLNSPGINGNVPEQLYNLDDIPIPDYSDFLMEKYPKTWHDPRIRDLKKMGSEFIYITGSRGCVRRCSFCDIESIWPKFRYRSGEKIAEEMMVQHQRYGSKKFLFTDSLLNGSVKQLTSLCETIIKYKEQEKMKDVIWQGQFIARSENQMPEEIYKLMKEAGLWFVNIGIESGSEKVRYDMNKKFDDRALDFTINMCERYNIEMSWLMLVGYPTEDETEFQKTLDFMTKYSYLNKKNIVRHVVLGPTLDIMPGSPLWKKQDEMGIYRDDKNRWVYKDNTRIVRIKRWLRLKDHCIKLNYHVLEKATQHLLNELTQYENTDHGAMGPSV